MAGQLIALPELARSVPKDLTPAKSVSVWIDLMETSYQLRVAGLRASIGAEGDLDAALRKWYQQQRVEHDRYIRQLAQRYHQRHISHAT
jgi:hypothetical protein